MKKTFKLIAIFCTAIILVSLFTNVFDDPSTLADAPGTTDVVTNGAVRDGSTDDSDAFLDAFTAINDYGNVIIPQGSYAISQNITVPSGINLVFENGAVLLVSNGYTITVNGTIEAGPVQIFSSSSSISGNIGGSGYVQWFGPCGVAGSDSTAPMQKAVNVLSHIMLINTNSYYYISGVTISDPIIIEGVGGIRTNICVEGTGNGFTIESNNVSFQNIYMWGNGSANSSAA
ncbi:MAG: hypothetical protein ACYC5K_10695, partial [Saccharofermentanales bacterium]